MIECYYIHKEIDFKNKYENWYLKIKIYYK